MPYGKLEEAEPKAQLSRQARRRKKGAVFGCHQFLSAGERKREKKPGNGDDETGVGKKKPREITQGRKEGKKVEEVQ